MIKFLSYAQELEDLILYDVLGDIKTDSRFYIDVGANDPWVFSVTKAFYDRGWHGINIEPLREAYLLLAEDRKQDINLNVGAGDIAGELEMSVCGGISSVSKEIIAEVSKNTTIELRTVPIETLTQICDAHCPAGQEIAFCKIDVENFEREVLLGFDLKKYRPKVFVIESTLPCTNIPCYDRWEYLLLENGYEFAYSYGVNRYYTETGSSLKGKFIGVDKLLEKYEVFLPVERKEIVERADNRLSARVKSLLKRLKIIRDFGSSAP